MVVFFMRNIFNDYGIEIYMIDNRYYLRYDAGEIASHYEEIEILKEEAEKAQLNSNNAYEVIIKYQNEALFGKKGAANSSNSNDLFELNELIKQRKNDS
jgi:predicted porin